VQLLEEDKLLVDSDHHIKIKILYFKLEYNLAEQAEAELTIAQNPTN
jgi:hypothetical protein